MLDELIERFMVPPYPADPDPLYRVLRDSAPVHRWSGGLWFASTYEAAAAVFRSPTLGQGRGAESRLRSDRRYGHSPALQTLSYMLPFIDPPDHTRLRALIARAFTPRAVDRMRGFLCDFADGLLAGMAVRGGGDVMADYANHIPVAVICEMLGAPADQHADLIRWSDALVAAVHPFVDDDHLAHADEGAQQFRLYVDALIAQRRADPRDDLLSALVQASDGADRLDRQELVSTVVVFIGAGIENTKHFIGSCIAQSIRRGGFADIAAATEEVLRLEPPVQLSLPRLALADTEIGGVSIPKGERVSALIAAANRDPRAFDQPEVFDPQRKGPPNLSLAAGAHFCTGAGLARLEAQVAVERFAARFPGARLAAEPQLRDDVRPSLRGYRELHVAV